MESESKELKVIDRRTNLEKEVETQTPNAVILKAMDKNYSPELIEKMMDLQERYEKRQAQKSYVKAMAEFKKNPPEILKTKHVEYLNAKNKTVQWDHAQLGEITEAIIKGLSEHELYHRWDREQPDKDTVKTTCIITHSDGHSERISMSAPPDTSGNKDYIKAVASTDTIQQRLTLLALTGLAAKGTDIEYPNQGDLAEFISKEQVTELTKDISDAGVMPNSFIKSLKVETLSELQVKDFQNVKNKLANIIKAKKKHQKQTREPGQEG